MAGNIAQRLDIFGKHRLLDKHGPVGLQLLGENLGHALMHPSVEIDAELHIITHGFPDGRRTGEHSLHLLI